MPCNGWFPGCSAPPAGWLGDRYGVRVTMAVGAAIFILGMVLTSTVNHLWQFYLYFGILVSASMGIFQVPLTAGVTLWFHRRLGVGMGLLQASQGLGPIVAVPLILLIVGLFGGGESGLRAAFWIPGIGGGILLLLLVRLFYNEPADIGIRPLGAAADEPAAPAATGGNRPRPGQGVPETGTAHPDFLEPDRHPLLGLRRPRHRNGVYRSHGRGGGGAAGPGRRNLCRPHRYPAP